MGKKSKKLKSALGHVLGGAVKQSSRVVVGHAVGNDSAVGRKLQSIVDKKVNQIVNKTTGVTGRGAYFMPTGSNRRMNTTAVLKGRGDYGVALNNKFPASGIPLGANVSSRGGVVRISHSEMIGNILSPATPTAFNNTLLPLNPGMATTFPWLAVLAQRFERYRFVQLVFEFKNALAVASTSGALGQVAVVVVANAAKGAIESWPGVVNYEGSLVMVANEDFSVGVECAEGFNPQAWYYVRSAALPDNQDIKTYDPGSLQIATYGLSAAALPTGTNLGMLRVHYTVEFDMPTMNVAIGSTLFVDEFVSSAAATGMSSTIPFGTDPRQSSQNTIGGSLLHAANNVYTFPDNFTGEVTLIWTGKSAASCIPVVALAASGAFVNEADWSSGVGTSDSAWSASTSTTFGLIRTFFVNPATTPGGNYITFTTTSNPPTQSFLMIQMRNPLLGAPFASAGVSSNWVAVV